jgi:CubicO group peptidase (beta-lactamase class C family)
VANGGLNASIPDMARYLTFLLGSAPADGGMQGAADAAGPGPDAVLARSSLEEMWRTVVPIGESGIGRESMGLSFFLYDQGGRRLVGHTGTQRAFYSFFILDPASGVGAIAAFNSVGEGTSPPRTDDLRVSTRAALANDLFPLFRSRP